MSIRLFHPMVAPHIQQVARALHEAGQLDRYVTTIVERPDSRLQRLSVGLARTLGLDLARELSRRRVTEVPLDNIESHPAGEFLRVAVARASRSDPRIHDFVWERLERAFDHRVARGLHAGLSGVYGYEFSSLLTFIRARRLGLGIAYDLPSPEGGYVEGLLRAETEQDQRLRTPFSRWMDKRLPGRVEVRRQEFALATVVLANSTFTRDSYAATGCDLGKVRVLPLGAPPPVPPEVALRGGGQADETLRLLWAGTFSIRKGAHHLVEAWRRHRLGQGARLDVYGSVALPERMLSPLPEGIHFHQSVPRDELMAAYTRADALMFPTLCDGFGMVVTEAWSRGLPVLLTRRAGAADLARDGENGRIFAAADPDAIAGVVHWCQEHRSDLKAMRRAARQTAASRQWSDYRRELAQILIDIGLVPTP